MPPSFLFCSCRRPTFDFFLSIFGRGPFAAFLVAFMGFFAFCVCCNKVCHPRWHDRARGTAKRKRCAVGRYRYSFLPVGEQLTFLFSVVLHQHLVFLTAIRLRLLI